MAQQISGRLRSAETGNPQAIERFLRGRLNIKSDDSHSKCRGALGEFTRACTQSNQAECAAVEFVVHGPVEDASAQVLLRERKALGEVQHEEQGMLRERDAA